MKATISTDRQTIKLENGTVFTSEGAETAADFMSRVRKAVKDEFLEDLKIEKAGPLVQSPELDAMKKQLIEDSDKGVKDRAAKSTKKTLTAEEKAEVDAQIKVKLEEAKRLKEEEKQKKLEEKAKLKEQKDKEKAEAKAKAEADKAEAQAKLIEEKRAENEAKGAQMIADAEAKAVEMVQLATEKAQEYVAKVKEDVQKLIETGSLPKVKGQRAPRVASEPGVRVEPEQSQIDYIDSIVGSRVSIEKQGVTYEGKIIARSIDYRVGIVFARIVTDSGLTMHKSFNKIGDITFLETPVEA